MDKNRIKGAVKQTEGAIKETAGKLTGNIPLEMKGKQRKEEGRVQKAYGKAKDTMRDL